MTFQCKKNCRGDCCGIIGFPKELIKKTEHLAQVKPLEIVEIKDKIFPMTKDLICIYLNRMTKKCMIYDLRPEVCKLYGTSDILPCPYVRPDGTPRNFHERKMIQMRIDNTVDNVLNKYKNLNNLEN